MADEHAGKYTGFAGHPVVQTPNLDRLAARGTSFLNAYCNSPICMPSRAAFATGQYPHQTGYYCNATPYDGQVEGWPHVLKRNGVNVTSIGKLHYRDVQVDTGFTEARVPMHAVDGVGDLFGAIRDRAPLPVRYGVRQVAEQVGRGDSNYTRYDRSILSDSLNWLETVAPTLEEPFVLFVSFVCPHFPLIAPDEFYDLYDPDNLELPKACRSEDWPEHPWFDAFRSSYITDTFFDDDLRRQATAAYFGLCSFVDSLIGQIVDAVDSSPFSDRTRMIYTSDHGDNLGVRGLWQKSNFYQESANVPMIAVGEGVPVGEVCETPVSLVDIFPTALEATGVTDAKGHTNPDAQNLFSVAAQPYDSERTVFGEYHAAGAVNGVFMLRQGDWKYIHYANMPPQLFNLQNDPEELRDLAGDAAFASVLDRFQKELEQRLDPVAVDKTVKKIHKNIVLKHGGAENILSRGSMGASPPPGTTHDSVQTK
ncbi:sulfatase-like hydrolase/transferase [Sulfitobacter mediterraneus]|uniref:sulfatase-like hydrolase/transferase n=1 Tax=Sulfitobacter mediterraneus TaxID=83219 RepID=UPI0021A3D7AA|nr:sulfatase-like hydrolase/transferase [Sulfitobacter mediterraneus]